MYRQSLVSRLTLEAWRCLKTLHPSQTIRNLRKMVRYTGGRMPTSISLSAHFVEKSRGLFNSMKN